MTVELEKVLDIFPANFLHKKHSQQFIKTFPASHRKLIREFQITSSVSHYGSFRIPLFSSFFQYDLQRTTSAVIDIFLKLPTSNPPSCSLSLGQNVKTCCRNLPGILHSPASTQPTPADLKQLLLGSLPCKTLNTGSRYT